MKELFMKITKTDPYLDEEVTLDIPITQTQYEKVINRTESNIFIQDIVPHLSVEHREFLISGISPKGWLKHIDACEELKNFVNEMINNG
jgi:hypothetical protein